MSPLILPDDDGIVVAMSENEPRTITREEFNRELVQALDDLVASARYHGELIKASFKKGEEVSRRADAERARATAVRAVVRETPPPYGEVPQRLDYISCLALAAVIITGCGKESPVGPMPPPPAQNTLAIAGAVVGNPDQRAVPDASVTLGGLSTTTNALGRFSFTMQQDTSGRTAVRVAAAGHITRDSFLFVSQPLTDLVIDTITDAPPFSIDFYRQFARNAHDSPASLSPTMRWTMPPSFYIKTTVDETGEAIPSAWIDRLKTIFINSVPELSGGRLKVNAIETGPEARPSTNGWVNVLFQRVLRDPNAGGAATVGGNQGTLWLRYYPGEVTPGGAVPRPQCEFLVVSAAEHEIVHTMGYFHTNNIQSHFFTEACNGANRASIVRHHAGLVYSRPPGNTDPDTDPPSFSLGLSGGMPLRPVTVSCRF